MAHEPDVRFVPGSRFAVMLIHGIAGTPDHFDALIPVIPQDWSVYNILLDGHGQGVEEFGATSMKRWKKQVNNTLEALFEHHEQVVLVGHSMGTLFSIQAAIDHPDRISRLFLLAVPTRPRVQFTTAVAGVRLALGDNRWEKSRAMENASSVKLDWRLWKYIPWVPRFWELLVECDRVRKLLPQLTVPCDAFQSENDELVAHLACRDLSGIDSITLNVLPNSGHFDYSEEDMAFLQSRLAQRLEAMEKASV